MRSTSRRAPTRRRLVAPSPLTTPPPTPSQELQSQLLDQKLRGVNDSLHDLQLKASRAGADGGMAGVGVQQLEKMIHKKMAAERGRLASSTAVCEERVSDATKVNDGLIGTINELRRGRRRFKAQVEKFDHKEISMEKDMKHFAQARDTTS